MKTHGTNIGKIWWSTRDFNSVSENFCCCATFQCCHAAPAVLWKTTSSIMHISTADDQTLLMWWENTT